MTETTLDTSPTLYKRTKTGAIQYYTIKAQRGFDNEQGGQGWHIIKTSGQLGTANPIVHKETLITGKNQGRANATSVGEQAVLQAQSDWRRKRDEGYKSLADLGYGTKEEIVDQLTSIVGIGPSKDRISLREGDGDRHSYTLEQFLEKNLPKFNTDASGNVKPMLAKAVDWKKVVYPCYVQPKLDGVRCLMVVGDAKLAMAGKSAMVPTVTFLSRSGKEYTTLNHIKADVLDAMAARDVKDPFILDGEIYSDEISFQEITQAVKKQYPNSLKLKFRAYDIVNEEDQETRLGQVADLVSDIASPHVEMVETIHLSSEVTIKAAHDTWVKEGYEGAMIRIPSGHYAQGQRSSHLLKVKEFDESEFAFKNFEFGQRGVDDLVAVLWNDGPTGPGNFGTEFRAKVQGSTAQKQALYDACNNGEREGAPFTIKYFKRTNDGLPRFPIGKGFRLKEDQS